MARKRIMGRPPASWMYELAAGKHLPKKNVLSLEEIAECFKVSRQAVDAFCRKAKLRGDFNIRGRFAVITFKAKELQEAAHKYVLLYQGVTKSHLVPKVQ
ncbi:MAG: hypothetical protein HYW48_09625 [Deltaproteobacteria bacterium]|nr:hypothetical protein [Deltaproteobacteria bacterium]